MTNFAEIAQQIISNNYSPVGVRSLCLDEVYQVGEDCRDSYEWDLEADQSTYYTTGQTADGTCATHIDTSAFDTQDRVAELAHRIEAVVKANAKTNLLHGGTQVIITGSSVNNDGYFDPDEVRIRNARVIAVL